MATRTVQLRLRQAPCADVHKLQNAVNSMDCLSQIGFSEIGATAKLALLALETRVGQTEIGALAGALQAISARADDIQNCINSTAEEVGCNYVDKAQQRRGRAASAARNAADVPNMADFVAAG